MGEDGRTQILALLLFVFCTLLSQGAMLSFFTSGLHRTVNCYQMANTKSQGFACILSYIVGGGVASQRPSAHTCL